MENQKVLKTHRHARTHAQGFGPKSDLVTRVHPLPFLFVPPTLQALAFQSDRHSSSEPEKGDEAPTIHGGSARSSRQRRSDEFLGRVLDLVFG